jgi:hypothetical protein
LSKLQHKVHQQALWQLYCGYFYKIIWLSRFIVHDLHKRKQKKNVFFFFFK